MVLCDTCKHLGNMASWPCEDCLQGDRYERKPTTNAEKYFRNATDEEIAKWIHRHDCHTNLYGYDNEEAILDWLKKEAE